MNKKFDYECEIASNFLDVLGISCVGLTDPLETFKKETGVDVQALMSSNKKIGIQVTVFHSDEASVKNGSESCRGREEKDKKLEIIQAYGVPTDYRPALQKRIEEKISKAQSYSFNEFDEVWLVITASLPQHGAIASTTIISSFINIEELNIDSHEALSQSKYSTVFLYVYNEKAIFQWQPLTKWQLAKSALKPILTSEGGFSFVKNCLNNAELRSDPHGWARREAFKVLCELRRGKENESE